MFIANQESLLLNLPRHIPLLTTVATGINYLSHTYLKLDPENFMNLLFKLRRNFGKEIRFDSVEEEIVLPGLVDLVHLLVQVVVHARDGVDLRRQAINLFVDPWRKLFWSNLGLCHNSSFGSQNLGSKTLEWFFCQNIAVVFQSIFMPQASIMAMRSLNMCGFIYTFIKDIKSSQI